MAEASSSSVAPFAAHRVRARSAPPFAKALDGIDRQRARADERGRVSRQRERGVVYFRARICAHTRESRPAARALARLARETVRARMAAPVVSAAIVEPSAPPPAPAPDFDLRQLDELVAESEADDTEPVAMGVEDSPPREALDTIEPELASYESSRVKRPSTPIRAKSIKSTSPLRSATQRSPRGARSSRNPRKRHWRRRRKRHPRQRGQARVGLGHR